MATVPFGGGGQRTSLKTERSSAFSGMSSAVCGHAARMRSNSQSASCRVMAHSLAFEMHWARTVWRPSHVQRRPRCTAPHVHLSSDVSS